MRNGQIRMLRDCILLGCAAGFGHPSMPLPHSGGTGDMGTAPPPQPPPKEKPKKRRKKKKADDGDSSQSQPLPPSLPSQSMLSMFVFMSPDMLLKLFSLSSIVCVFILSLFFSLSFSLHSSLLPSLSLSLSLSLSISPSLSLPSLYLSLSFSQ